METENVVRLLRVLSEATSKGTARWSTGSRDDTFIWSGSNASVTVLTKDNDGAPPFIVRLIDSDGRVVEEQLYGGPFSPPDELKLVQDLYEAARSDALDITGTIKGLLDDLGNLDF